MSAYLFQIYMIICPYEFDGPRSLAHTYLYTSFLNGAACVLLFSSRRVGALCVCV